VEFVVDKVALEQVFKYFGFPCQSSFYQLLHNHHLSSGVGTIGQTVAAVPSALNFNPLRIIKKDTYRIFLKELKKIIKISVRIVCDTAEILTGHLSSTNLKHYRVSQLVKVKVKR
jgi:hypothetical protein